MHNEMLSRQPVLVNDDFVHKIHYPASVFYKECIQKCVPHCSKCLSKTATMRSSLRLAESEGNNLLKSLLDF